MESGLFWVGEFGVAHSGGLLYAKRMAWVIGWMLGFCALALGQTPAFRVPPHLFLVGDRGLGLAWSYETPEPIGQSVSFEQGSLSTALVPYGDASLRWVALPWVPEDTALATYWLEGMPSKITIERLPAAGEATGFKFAFLSDSHADVSGELAARLAALADRHGGPFALHGGDLVNEGSHPEEWLAFWKAAAPWVSRRPFLASVGNHDYRGGQYQRQLQQSPATAFRRLRTGPLELILLNSNFDQDPSLLERQLPWLEAWLRQPVRWRIVVLHHPPFTTEKFSRKSGVVKAEKPALALLRDRFVPLFSRYGVDLVLGGDSHVFQQMRHGCVHYLVAGPAGGKIKAELARLTPHPLANVTNPVSTITLFEVSPRRLEAVTRSAEGETLSTLELSKP